MVQNVEQLSPELQLQRLVNGKLAMDCKIPLSSAKSPERIPRQVSLANGQAGRRVKRRRCECRWIECFSAGVLRSL